MSDDVIKDQPAGITAPQARHADGVAPAPRAIGRVNWHGLGTLVMREIMRFLKVAGQTIIAPVITTLLFFTVFALALGGVVRETGDLPFLVFLAPGLVMMGLAQNAFQNTSSSLVIAKVHGTIDDILMSPLSPAELATGYILGGVARGLAVGLVTLLCMLPFVNPGLHSLFWVVFHGVAGAAMMAMLGMVAGIWADKFDKVAAFTNFVVTPLTFLSGTFYSIDRLPPEWQVLALFNPFFYMIDGFRYGFTGEAGTDVLVGGFVMLGVNIALIVLILRILRTGWKLKS